MYFEKNEKATRFTLILFIEGQPLFKKPELLWRKDDFIIQVISYEKQIRTDPERTFFANSNSRVDKKTECPGVLVLGVEGTIIADYDCLYSDPDKEGRYPALISQSIATELEKFYNKGWKIVLATGTDGANIEYYKREFEKYGFFPYIEEFYPKNHSSDDSKLDKLEKYAKQFGVEPKYVHFFDDGSANIKAAVEAGFNATRVSNINPLEDLLANLSATIEASKINFGSSS